MGEVATAVLNSVIFQVGPPKVLTSDRGKEFLNQLFQEVTHTLGIEHHKTTSYHPNSNSVVERANRNLGIAISKKVNKFHDNWDTYLPAITFGLNTCVHSITGKIPFELVYLKPVTVVTDLMFPKGNKSLAQHRRIVIEIREEAQRRIQIQQLKSQERRNEKLIDDQLQVGDLCLVKRPMFKEGQAKKFVDRYHGPYKVIQVLKDGLFKVQLIENEKKEEVVNLINLRRYYQRNEEEKEIEVESAVRGNQVTLLNETEFGKKKPFEIENQDILDFITDVEITTQVSQESLLDPQVDPRLDLEVEDGPLPSAPEIPQVEPETLQVHNPFSPPLSTIEELDEDDADETVAEVEESANSISPDTSITHGHDVSNASTEYHDAISQASSDNNERHEEAADDEINEDDVDFDNANQPPIPPPRRSARIRKPPDRFQ